MKMYDYLDDRQTKRLKELVPYEILAPDADEIIKELERLNNIINCIDNFVDRTIEVIKQQPSDNDEWILERLNGIKYLKELKENNKWNIK